MTSRSDYVALRCLTHGTHLFSQTKPEQLAEACKQKKIRGIAITDNNLSMCVQYYKAMKKADMKPLIGCQISICPDFSTVHSPDNIANKTLVIIARNYQGWVDLLNITYETNHPARYENGPRISIDELKEYIYNNNNLVIYGDCSFNSHDLDNLARNVPYFFVGYNPIESGSTENIRKLGIPVIPTTPNFCINKEDIHNNRILLASYYHTNLRSDNSKYHQAFNDDRYFIPSIDELAWATDEEIANTHQIYDLIEDFDITRQQVLPDFSCPDNKTQDQYLQELCEKGLKRLDLYNNQKYIDRLNHELSVISHAKMSGYFLIVQDFINWAKLRGCLFGASRGSAGGCLISFLTNISTVDPIKYNLLFERFYTIERPEHPDIDIDVPPDRRDEIVEYITNKYGKNNFMQLCTFNTLKGLAALKRCLSTSKKEIAFIEQNEITKEMPLESKIISLLKDQEKIHGTESMVFWCIKNRSETFSQWCDSQYEGVYGDEFRSAVELDQVIQSRGRHACAFALSNCPINKVAPVIYDASSRRHIVGVNMKDAESLGLVKIDILGVDLLTKCQKVVEIVKNGCC